MTDKNSTAIEKDELLSFQLRARLSDIDFGGLIWRVMSHSPQWTYKGSAYYLNGKNLGSAKHAMEKLDAFALPYLTFRNGIDTSQDRDFDESLKASRLDLLEKIFYFCKENDRPIPMHYFDIVPDPKTDVVGFSDINISDEKTPKLKPRRPNNVAVSNEPGTEQYFAKLSKKKQHEKPYVQISQDTFETTASKLKWPNPTSCVDEVRNKSLKNDIASSSITQNFEKYHDEWRFLLSTKHSLLFYGFGSKRGMINEFSSKSLQPTGDVLILNGYDPSISVASILDLFVDMFLNGIHPSIPATPEYFDSYDIGMVRPSPISEPLVVTRAISIGKAVGLTSTKPIYLVIHNIEGSGLRNPNTYKALSALVFHSDAIDGVNTQETDSYRSRVVRLVASVDHIDAPSFLDMDVMANFSWIWMHTDTNEAYYDEVKHSITDEARRIKSTQKQILDYVFMKKVLDSIAPKHTDILKALANLQIEKGKEDNASGGFAYVEYSEWKSKCIKTLMIVSKDPEFFSMFNELRDHGMIRLKHDGVLKKDFVCIPTTKNKVHEILKSLESSR